MAGSFGTTYDADYKGHEGWGRKMFWAWAVTADKKVTLVCCKSADDAALERDRMRMSEAKTIGCMSRKTAEHTMRDYFRSQGWKMAMTRNFN